MSQISFDYRQVVENTCDFSECKLASKKIVAHVLPINGKTPEGTPAIEAMAAGSFLVSYYYTRPGMNKIGN